MTQKKIRIVIAIIVILILSYIARLFVLNTRYPSPKVESVSMNQELKLKDYSVKMISWDWEKKGYFKSIYPHYTSVEGVASKQVIVTLQITKITNKKTKFDFRTTAFESGGWANQWDVDLFEQLNEPGSLVFTLNKGETKIIKIPLNLLEIQFKKNAWNNIEKRPFFWVVQNYPKKLMIENK